MKKALVKVGDKFCMKCKNETLAIETTPIKDAVKFVCRRCHSTYKIDWTGKKPRPLLYDPKDIQHFFDPTYNFI